MPGVERDQLEGFGIYFFRCVAVARHDKCSKKDKIEVFHCNLLNDEIEYNDIKKMGIMPVLAKI